MLIKKIKTLTSNMPERKEVAISIFKDVINKVEDDFKFEECTYKDVYRVVSRVKNSKTRGENEVCNSLLREIPQFMTLAIQHLVNSIIRTGKFPNELKVSRVIPLKKKGKDSSLLESFRPINNLNPIEKCVEDLLKKQLDSFFKDNHVIPEYHHGS